MMMTTTLMITIITIIVMISLMTVVTTTVMILIMIIIIDIPVQRQISSLKSDNCHILFYGYLYFPPPVAYKGSCTLIDNQDKVADSGVWGGGGDRIHQWLRDMKILKLKHCREEVSSPVFEAPVSNAASNQANSLRHTARCQRFVYTLLHVEVIVTRCMWIRYDSLLDQVWTSTAGFWQKRKKNQVSRDTKKISFYPCFMVCLRYCIISLISFDLTYVVFSPILFTGNFFLVLLGHVENPCLEYKLHQQVLEVIVVIIFWRKKYVILNILYEPRSIKSKSRY